MVSKFTDDSQDQVYIKVLAELRRLINTDYKDGGRLPSSREMCEKMQINRNTYRKAISRLIADRYVTNFYQRGIHVVPDCFRCHKIGLALRDVEDSPFIQFPMDFSDAIQEAHFANYSTQIIQSAKPENLLRKATLHGVNSLVWFYSSCNALQIAREAAKDVDIPIVMVGSVNPKSEEWLDFDSVNHVTIDYQELGRKRAEFFIERGHKSVVYVGNSFYAEYTGFFGALRKSGVKVNDQLCFDKENRMAEKLAEYIKSENVTGIFSEGSNDLLLDVFSVVSAIQKETGVIPETVVVGTVFSGVFNKMYPELFRKFRMEYAEAELGKAAMQMLVRHLDDGMPLKSIDVPVSYKITL